jgi:hypothetical protein
MNSAFRQRRQQTAGLADDIHNGSIIGEHGENGLAVSRRSSDRGHGLGAEIGQAFKLFRGAIVDPDVVAGIDQAARHGLAHAAKPNKSDLHDVSL